MALDQSAQRGPSSRSGQATADAIERLRDNPYMYGQSVSCECVEGVLRLKGVVRTYFQKQVAQEAVKFLDGISKVVNELEVTG